MRQVEGTTLRGEEATLPGPAGPKSSVIYLAFPAISKSPPVFDFTGKRRSRSRQLLSVTQRYIRGTGGNPAYGSDGTAKVHCLWWFRAIGSADLSVSRGLLAPRALNSDIVQSKSYITLITMQESVYKY